MPLLQVRDFPKELYDDIAKMARAENRSVPQQTIVLLKAALSGAKKKNARRKAALLDLESFNIKNTNQFPPPEKITREERDK
jgi:hypothetical protein